MRRWWHAQGAAAYPQALRLLVTADAGGSNRYRTRAWKSELAALAAQAGLEITVCHFPPGTSKWNQIEHRLFSHISMNWRDRPLTSHEVIIIAATTTRTGLRVDAGLDTSHYPTGEAISDAHMAALAITRHDWHGEWNYTLHPASPEAAGHGEDHTAPPQRPSGPDRARLHAPALTGLTPAQWAGLIEKLGAARHAQREADLHDRRGAARQAAAGTGRRPALTLDDGVALTLLDLRFSLPKPLLEDLDSVTRTTINTTIRKTRPLLILTGYTPETTASGSATSPNSPGSSRTQESRYPRRRSRPHVNHRRALSDLVANAPRHQAACSIV